MPTEKMTKEEIIIANKEYLFPAVFHFYQEPLVIARGKDQYVWDADGNQYLDFLGGIVTVSVGHCNDQIDAKVHRQIDTLQHVSTLFANEPQAALAKKIESITPGGSNLPPETMSAMRIASSPCLKTLRPLLISRAFLAIMASALAP